MSLGDSCVSSGVPRIGWLPHQPTLEKYDCDPPEPVRHARTRGEQLLTNAVNRGLRAVTTLAGRVGPDRTQEIDAAEVGPVGLAEVELALRALPEQEAAEALLAGGSDHQVRIGLALGVEVLCDV